MLKQWHSTMFLHRFDQERFSAKQRYFEMATRFLNAHTFESSLEKDVWDLHANGKSLREIAKSLTTETVQISKDGALKIIRKFRVLMGDYE